MARGAVSSSILLMLYLEAALLLLVAAGASAAAVDVVPGATDAIRLPTDLRGVADVVTAMASAANSNDEERRPWKCCNLAVCTRSQPPICRCLDKVSHCSSACKHCDDVATTGDTDDTRRSTCADWYKGHPGPRCHDNYYKDEDASSGLAAADDEGKKKKKGGGGETKKRPWKCCSLPICTRSQPPVCHCWGVVKRCSCACERCEKVEGEGSSLLLSSGGSRYRCLDTHRGDPGPRCEEEWAPTVAASYHF